MTRKLTREQLHERARENVKALKMASRQTAFGSIRDELLADLQLAEYALAAMDSEPVVFTDERNLHHIAMGRETSLIWGKQNSETGDVPLYRHAQQPVVRPAPECEHQWRHGGANKLQNQKQCIKCGRVELDAQPAPVVPDESYQQLSELYHAQEKRLFKIAQRIKGPAFDKYAHSPSQAIDVLEAAIFGEDDASHAAMLQAGDTVRDLSTPVDPQVAEYEQNVMQAGNYSVIGIDPASGPDRTVEVRYVAPPGYVMVPKEPTEAMINAWLSEVANWRGHVAGYKAMLATAPQELKP